MGFIMDDKKEIRTELKDRRKELGMTMKEVADIVVVSEATISRWESGNIANMRRDRIAKLANALKVSPALIMGWDTPRNKDSQAPLFEAAAGEARHTEWYSSEECNIRLEEDEVAVRVVGRSMEPTLQDGDVVVVIAQNVIDYPRQIALVKVNGDEAPIKRVEIKDNGIMLLADNIDVYPPHFYTSEDVQMLPVEVQGVVTRLIRDIK